MKNYFWSVLLILLIGASSCSSLSTTQTNDTKTDTPENPSDSDSNSTENENTDSSTTGSAEPISESDIPPETTPQTSCTPDYSTLNLSTFTDISSGLLANSIDEPSGAVWHERLEKIITIDDDGIIAFLDSDGTNVSVTTIGNDIEGITIVDPASDFLYIGVERLSTNNHIAILEYKISTGTVTRTFDLSTWMHPSDVNSGLEALTFVPNTSGGGNFYAGMQENNTLYVFELPLTDSASTTVTPKSFFTSPYNEIADLTYFAPNNTLYALYDTRKKLVAMDTSGNFIDSWTLPELDLEAFTINPQCQWFFGTDPNRSAENAENVAILKRYDQ